MVFDSGNATMQLLPVLQKFFDFRAQRGGRSLSLHSWGIAIDVNPKTNALGKTPTLSPAFVACFKETGFDWGGDWKRRDGMHFQLAQI